MDTGSPISEPLRVDAERTDQLFHNPHVSLFLFRLFQLSGLYGNLDIQGAWTLSVLPQTNGDRWFTLNIGPHEVAFSTRTSIEEKFSHYIVLDRLILEYPETIMWLGRHGGDVREADYKTAERALTVRFDDDFAKAERSYALKGVRRAIVAYWADALANLRERNAKSVYARYLFATISTLTRQLALVSVTDLCVAARQQPLKKVAPRRFSPHLRRFA